MNNDSQTEEKTLPASKKKLRDARRKGKVSSSKDLISGVGLLSMLAYFFLTWPTLRDRLLEFMGLVGRSYNQPFNESIRIAISVLFEILFLTMAPAVAVLVIASVVAGMIGTQGPVFSFEPVKPKFENINPMSGLKRVFSTRNLVEFAKSLTKVALLGAVLFLVLRYWLQAMFHTPNCGEACIVSVLLAAVKPILAIAALAFIIIGISDFAVQRWLFLRDMRMGKTEAKRERKDIEGDPLILSARKRQRYIESRGPRLGLATANILITSNDYIAGIYYDRQRQPLPLIVIRTKGSGVGPIKGAAEDLNIPVFEDSELAQALVEKHRPGDLLHVSFFSHVAPILVRYGLAK